MPKQFIIPEGTFQPGLDPGLREWLNVRRQAREAKIAQSSGTINFTYAKAIKYRYKNWWLSQVNGCGDLLKSMPMDQFMHCLQIQHSMENEEKDLLAQTIILYRGLKYLQLAHTHGFDLNYRLSSSGMSLLHQAVHAGDEEKVVFLLDHQVDTKLKDNRLRTPLHLSIQPITPFTPLSISLDLLRKGVDVNAQDNEGRTVLHLACIAKSRDHVELFISRRAKINVVDEKGKIPYDYAATKVYC
jgi:hypothetical protein